MPHPLLLAALAGGGDLAPPSAYAVGPEPAALLAVDLDLDLDLDLVCADRGADALTVLWNDGDGAFPAATTLALPAGARPAALAPASHGGAKLAVACAGAGALRYVDAAGATVHSAAWPAALSAPSDAAAGDLDGAGGLDVVVAFAGELLRGGGGLATFADAGAGAPAAVAAIAPPDGFGRARRVALCDPDADGDLDVAVTAGPRLLDPEGAAGGVLLYANDGAGALSFAGRIPAADLAPAPAEAFGLAALDADADGHADLAVGVDAPLDAAPGVVLVLRHDGGGALAPASFTASSATPAGALPIDLAAGDLDGDGLPGFLVDADVAAAAFGSAELALCTSFDAGLGALGGFGAGATTAAGVGPVAVLAAHLDRDHTLDVAVLDAPGEAAVVLLSAPGALAQTFGAGCAGTGGLAPEISAVGLPSFGNPAFGIALAHARPLAPALLGISPQQTTAALGGGCTLYLGAPIPYLPASTDAAGAATVELAMPPDAAPYAGLDLYFQYIVFDPFGTFLGAYAPSDALRIKIGA